MYMKIENRPMTGS